MRGIGRDIVALKVLSAICLLVLPAMAGSARLSVIAEAQTPAAGAPAASEAPTQPPAAKDVTKDATAKQPATETAPAKKSALSIPACSVRYLEAKVEGKLNGRKWVDFRRDECGAKDTTAVFPTEISPKYSTEKDLDKARTLTCADQFKANKATDANGGLKWVEKDGGYYGECVIRLKG
jgi:hypothetical protein